MTEKEPRILDEVAVSLENTGGIISVEDARAVMQAEAQEAVRECGALMQDAMAHTKCAPAIVLRTTSGIVIPIDDYLPSGWSAQLAFKYIGG